MTSSSPIWLKACIAGVLIAILVGVAWMFYSASSASSQPDSQASAPLPPPCTESGAVSPCWTVSLTEVLSSLTQPIGLAHAGDGSNRLFILEKGGVIKVLQNGQLATTPFLDLTGTVNPKVTEGGLLGLAFDPNFSTNRYFYVNYTDQQGKLILARYQTKADDTTQADPASATVLSVTELGEHHHGGNVVFGPDGWLYLGTGDEYQPHLSQDAELLSSKLLKIDVHQQDETGALSKPTVVALGLRNPWRYSFDRKTGDLYIADVGSDFFEEVNFIAASDIASSRPNFGWAVKEGTVCRNTLGEELTDLDCATPPESKSDHFTDPVFVYGHTDAEQCSGSITGGFVYRGQKYPFLDGTYLASDFCTGQVYGLHRDSTQNWQGQVVGTSSSKSTAFGEDEAGELYVTDFQGKLYAVTAEVK